MVEAFRVAEEKSGHKIALISNSALKPLLKPSDTWCIEDNIFGHASRDQYIGKMIASDYYLNTTVCEGFGVPPLEAMSVSKPVVCGKFRPLTEFINDACAIWYPCENVRYEDYGMEQDFEMHYYEPNDLVDAILKAVDLYVNYEDSYHKMCESARQIASAYDYRKVYGIELRKYLA
jgi:glycosyltransferase involved in cell wall biosynthesis